MRSPWWPAIVVAALLAASALLAPAIAESRGRVGVTTGPAPAGGTFVLKGFRVINRKGPAVCLDLERRASGRRFNLSGCGTGVPGVRPFRSLSAYNCALDEMASAVIASQEVSRVEVELADGRKLAAARYELPAALRFRGSFFVLLTTERAQTPDYKNPLAIRSYDAAGRRLGAHHFPRNSGMAWDCF